MNYFRLFSKAKTEYSTAYSQAVTHPSTNAAQCCLTSVIGRELVFSTWYGRIQGSTQDWSDRSILCSLFKEIKLFYRTWQKVTGLAILEGLWNINHSLALSHYWSTRGLLAAGFPPWPDSPFIRQPGLVELPLQDHVEANLSADARSTWADETQNSPPQDFHSNWPPSSWITITCQSYRSWGLVFFFLIIWRKIYLCEKKLEMRGIEPRAFHMQSERSTTELHPLAIYILCSVRYSVLLLDRFKNDWSLNPKKEHSLFSSVVEHWSRKPGVMSSNLIGGNHFLCLT